jgi:hypothetical protein
MEGGNASGGDIIYNYDVSGADDVKGINDVIVVMTPLIYNDTSGNGDVSGINDVILMITSVIYDDGSGGGDVSDDYWHVTCDSIGDVTSDGGGGGVVVTSYNGSKCGR